MRFKKIENIKEYVQTGIDIGMIKPDRYVKSTTIKARKGIVGEKISTITSNGVHETDNIVSKDQNGNVDWVVTNITGEKYIIKDSVFSEKYESVEGTGDVFRPKGNPILAGKINESISFVAPWGENMNLVSGGYLVFTDMNDIYGVQEEEFKRTYKKI